MDTARDMAQRLAALPPQAVRLTKRLIRHGAPDTRGADGRRTGVVPRTARLARKQRRRSGRSWKSASRTFRRLRSDSRPSLAQPNRHDAPTPAEPSVGDILADAVRYGQGRCFAAIDWEVRLSRILQHQPLRPDQPVRHRREALQLVAVRVQPGHVEQEHQRPVGQIDRRRVMIRRRALRQIGRRAAPVQRIVELRIAVLRPVLEPVACRNCTILKSGSDRRSRSPDSSDSRRRSSPGCWHWFHRQPV